MNISPIKPTIGASVSGVDLNHLTDDDKATLKNALLTHQVLFFKAFDQPIASGIGKFVW